MSRLSSRHAYPRAEIAGARRSNRWRKPKHATPAGARLVAGADAGPDDHHASAHVVQLACGPAVRLRIGGGRIRVPFGVPGRIGLREQGSYARIRRDATGAVGTGGEGLRSPCRIAAVPAVAAGPD